MLTVYSTDHNLHHGVELKDGKILDSFEKPLRAEAVLAQVERSGLGSVVCPDKFDLYAYPAVHSERYLHFLQDAWTEWCASGRTCQALPLVWPVKSLPSSGLIPEFIDGKLGFFSMDAGTPMNAGTWTAVSSSANTAIHGADAVSKGERAAFSLCRPPGHHAGREYMGGYCYLNNAALAVQHLISRGATKVAVIDVDFHHGNGTQDIFYGRSDVLFVSIHGEPSVSYPYFSGHAEECGSGVGEGYNVNIPMPKGTDWQAYAAALQHALFLIENHGVDAIVVSLGVDTFEHDPISYFRLRSEDYLRMGEMIEQLGKPTLFVMEGGYMTDEIGINVANVLKGFEGQT